MDKEKEFKEILAKYGNVAAEDMTDDMRFREDLGLSSLDFMTLLGELEDTFDIEFEEEHASRVFTIGEALELIEELSE
ncbi:MAG: acyl carrier protein [Eubacterium sp.]|nr:acyl carrier protein [Eubacterium sp.]